MKPSDTLKFVCHQPNGYLEERPAYFDIEEKDGSLYVKGWSSLT